MHPAFSVIFFTTSSGAGYGLLALLGLMAPAGLLPADRWLGGLGLGLALAAISAGLLSSTFHLGRPERAWRALSQWRSSWLSREGVMALVAYVPAGLFGLGWVVLGETGGVWGAAGVAAALAAILTVACTAMIYRSLKPIRQWDNVWVLPSYLVLGLMTGALWLHPLAIAFGARHWALPVVTLAALAVGWGVKAGYWRFVDRGGAAASPESATGLRGGRVRPIERPHTQDNYLLKEMGYQVARRHRDRLRRVAHLAAFALPIALTAAAAALPQMAALAIAATAALAGSIGIVVERWLFFAEARHTVTLYYRAAT